MHEITARTVTRAAFDIYDLSGRETKTVSGHTHNRLSDVFFHGIIISRNQPASSRKEKEKTPLTFSLGRFSLSLSLFSFFGFLRWVQPTKLAQKTICVSFSTVGTRNARIPGASSCLYRAIVMGLIPKTLPSSLRTLSACESLIG